MESKGSILGKIASREEMDYVFPFKTRNHGASTTTKAKKPNATMARVKGSRLVWSDVQ
jgi:hypothetical protein